MAKSTDYETKRMNDAYWLFWVYQAAHMPRMLSWAKKKNKGQELQSMKELLSSYDRSTHKIVYGLAPKKAFDNMIQMLNAVHSTTYKEFSDEYFRIAPDAAAAMSGMPTKEFFSTQGNKTTLDETLRLGICYSNQTMNGFNRNIRIWSRRTLFSTRFFATKKNLLLWTRAGMSLWLRTLPTPM